MPPALPRLYLITDRLQSADEEQFLVKVEQALAGGVRLLQMREKDLTPGELFKLGQKLRQLTAQYDAYLLINDRVDLALALAADGVHLNENSLPTPVVRSLLGPAKLIGVSTHAVTQVKQQAQAGADFITFSPVFATPSKAAYGPPQGLSMLAAACQADNIPVYALGGVNAARVADCMSAGAFGVAVISAILAADDPDRSTQTLLRQI